MKGYQPNLPEIPAPSFSLSHKAGHILFLFCLRFSPEQTSFCAAESLPLPYMDIGMILSVFRDVLKLAPACQPCPRVLSASSCCYPLSCSWLQLQHEVLCLSQVIQVYPPPSLKMQMQKYLLNFSVIINNFALLLQQWAHANDKNLITL